MESKSKERWHGGHHYSNKVHFFLIFVLFLVAASLFWTYVTLHDESLKYENIPVKYVAPTIAPVQEGVACTMDALLCPDGSYVGRSGPNCEFTACPGE